LTEDSNRQSEVTSIIHGIKADEKRNLKLKLEISNAVC